jgi:hypothetical protein
MLLTLDVLHTPGHGEPTTVKRPKEEFANKCGDVLWLED